MKYLFLLGLWMNLLAHQSSLAFLNIQVENTKLVGNYKITVEDANLLYKFDDNFDSKIQWKEILQGEKYFKDIVQSQINFSTKNTLCKMDFEDIKLDYLNTNKYIHLGFTAECSQKINVLDIKYLLLFNNDSQHKVYANIIGENFSHQTLFAKGDIHKTVKLGISSYFEVFQEFLKEGIIHILIGYDHVLFLLTLLLTSVLYYEGNKYYPNKSMKKTFINIVKIITSFTVAHSITLTLSMLGYFTLESYITESLIAFSVVLAGLNNIKVVVSKYLWVFIFIFGLIHGIGFSSVLTDLGLSGDAKILSLISFNLGVELGQLFIIMVSVPLLFKIRKWKYYELVIVKFLSLMIVLIGIYWLYERLWTA